MRSSHTQRPYRHLSRSSSPPRNGSPFLLPSLPPIRQAKAKVIAPVLWILILLPDPRTWPRSLPLLGLQALIRPPQNISPLKHTIKEMVTVPYQRLATPIAALGWISPGRSYFLTSFQIPSSQNIALVVLSPNLPRPHPLPPLTPPPPLISPLQPQLARPPLLLLPQ